MRPTEHRWQLSALSEEDEELGRSLAHSLGLYPVMGRLLVERGVRSVEEAERFFHPRLEELHDPFLMQDMQAAVTRLSLALERGDRILIYGDYDVDGTTAVALLYRYLRAYCAPDQLRYHIPDRYDEGYGVTSARVAEAAEAGVQLIIAVDTGTKAVEEVAYARTLGIDFIICDHHKPDETLPQAVALLNPKRADNTYPFTELSGCGLAFKLLQGLAQQLGHPLSQLFAHLELLVLSIAQDRVSILGENRILCYHGLRQLNTSPSVGISYLMRRGKVRLGQVDMASIYYELGPRINAAGRMAHGAESVKLLIAEDARTAEAQSQILDDYNRQRQDLDQVVTRQALALVESQPALLERKILVLYHPEWNKGVMGIVAARLADRLHRPVIILARSGDWLAGSARSSGGFDLYAAIQACEDCLENFGGHTFAAGMTVHPDRLELFAERIEAYAHTAGEQARFLPTLEVDAELQPQEITKTLLRQLDMLYPFGTNNERPLFMTHRLRDAGGSRAVGRSLQHLNLRLTDYYQRIRPLHGFALGGARYAGALARHEAFALCYELEENNFYAQSFLQLRVKDICLEGELEQRLLPSR